MTDKDKELLLKDLCCRLPYRVILKCVDLVGEDLRSITKEGLINNNYDIDEVKPILFPLSSMTEEQKKECNFADDLDSDILDAALCTNHYHRTGIPAVTYNLVDWCIKNHFDYRGLIEKGIAIDATNLNIY